MRGLEWLHVLSNAKPEDVKHLREFADSTIMFPERVHDRWDSRAIADALEKLFNFS